MTVYYLEIVTHDVDGVCRSYEITNGVSFAAPDNLLGGARTCTLSDGSLLGVRSPLHDDEEPVVRPYWLVEDITLAVEQAEKLGAQIAVPVMEIPSKGKCAIYFLGANQHGVWQV